MAGEGRLQNSINEAYGGSLQGLDTSKIRDSFNKETERRREEYKSAQEIGSDLDEQYYNHIEGGFNDIMDSVTEGNMVPGSPAWARKMGDLKKQAIQVKKIQDMNEETAKLLRENPDKNLFYYTNEKGERVAGGYSAFMKNQQRLLDSSYIDVNELINQNAQMIQGIKPMNQGFTQGFKQLRTDAQDLSVKLLGTDPATDDKGNLLYRDVDINHPATGAMTISTASSLSPEQIKRMTNSFIDQYGELLRDDYAVKKGGVNVKKNVETTESEGGDVGIRISDMTEQEYVKSAIQDMFIREGIDMRTQRYSIPRKSDSDSGKYTLRSLAGGGYENDDFAFTIVDRAPDGYGDTPAAVNADSDLVNMKVTQKSNSESTRVFRDDERNKDMSGKLTNIIKRPSGIYLRIKPSGDDKSKEIPLGSNFATLNEFYYLTEDQVDLMFSGADVGDTVGSGEQGSFNP